MRSIISSLATSFIATASFADGIAIEKPYSFHQQSHLDKDAACIDAFKAKIVPGFRGLNGVVLEAPSIVDTSTGALAIYAGVKFLSLYGDANGTLNCSFKTDPLKVTDVGVTFAGKGLGGFESRGLSSASDDPADWVVDSYSAQIAH